MLSPQLPLSINQRLVVPLPGTLPLCEGIIRIFAPRTPYNKSLKYKLVGVSNHRRRRDVNAIPDYLEHLFQ